MNPLQSDAEMPKEDVMVSSSMKSPSASVLHFILRKSITSVDVLHSSALSTVGVKCYPDTT